MGRSNIKTGWWKVSFDLKLEGEEVQFNDLSEATQEHITQKIMEGYIQGEIVEEDDDDGDENSCHHCANNCDEEVCENCECKPE
jgi:hypothetical protein